MASEVKTNKVSPATGTDVTLGDASDTFTVPSGSAIVIASGGDINVQSSGEIDIASGATLDVNGTIDLTGATKTGFPEGLFSGYAIFADQKAQNTEGGTFTSGAWRQRDINTTIANTDTTNITLGTNEFTLLAGNYLIHWEVVAYYVAGAITRLHDGSSSVGQGLSDYYTNQTPKATGSARVTPGTSTTYQIQQYSNGTQPTDGFGKAANISVEQYLTVTIYKES